MIIKYSDAEFINVIKTTEINHEETAQKIQDLKEEVSDQKDLEQKQENN